MDRNIGPVKKGMDQRCSVKGFYEGLEIGLSRKNCDSDEHLDHVLAVKKVILIGLVQCGKDPTTDLESMVNSIREDEDLAGKVSCGDEDF